MQTFSKKRRQKLSENGEPENRLGNLFFKKNSDFQDFLKIDLEITQCQQALVPVLLLFGESQKITWTDWNGVFGEISWNLIGCRYCSVNFAPSAQNLTHYYRRLFEVRFSRLPDRCKKKRKHIVKKGPKSGNLKTDQLSWFQKKTWIFRISWKSMLK